MRIGLALLILVLGAVAQTPSGGALAQAPGYPVKPVRIIAGFPPGSGADITARVIGQKLGEAYGQQILVDNRLGAGSNIAAELAAKAPPISWQLYIIETYA